jgi:hypothetical protein
LRSCPEDKPRILREIEPMAKRFARSTFADWHIWFRELAIYGRESRMN